MAKMAKTKKPEAGKPQVRKPALKSQDGGHKDRKSKGKAASTTLAAPAKAVIRKADSKIRNEVINKAKNAKKAKESAQKEKHEEKNKKEAQVKG